MSPSMNVTRVVDAQGQMCPMPVITVAKAIRELQTGDVLALMATDKGAKADIPAWATKTGNTLISTVEENGVITFYIKKG